MSLVLYAPTIGIKWYKIACARVHPKQHAHDISWQFFGATAEFIPPLPFQNGDLPKSQKGKNLWLDPWLRCRVPHSTLHTLQFTRSTLHTLHPTYETLQKTRKHQRIDDFWALKMIVFLLSKCLYRGEAASSEKLLPVVHSSHMQHTEHKAQRKNLCVKMLVCTSVCV